MKIDREQLKKYTELDDAALWKQIRATASEYSYTLPEKQPSKEDMQRIRAIMLGTERIGISEGMKILNSYKKRGG